MATVLADRRVLAATLFVGGLLAVALWPTSIVVDLARVSRGPLVVTVDEEGRTRVRDRFLVAAPLTGWLRRIELEPGDRVSRGDVVARVHAVAPALLHDRARAEALAAVRSAEAVLGQTRADEERARVALVYAQRQLDRSRQLEDEGVTTTDEIEARELEAARAEHDLTAATFAVRVASAALERARVRRAAASLDGNRGRTVSIASPADGVVLRRLRQSEGLVSAGELLVEIGDVRQLEIVTALLSRDAVRLVPGAAASVAQWGGDTVLPATVRRIEPAGFSSLSTLGLEEQRVNVVLDFMDTGEDYASFGDAYRVDTRIVVWAAADVLKIPTSALIRHDGRWAVYVASEGRARRTLVTLGAHTGQEAEVTAGLSAGTMVVVHPSDLMHDGVRIVDRTTR